MHGMSDVHWFLNCICTIFNSPLPQGEGKMVPVPVQESTSMSQGIKVICGYCGAEEFENCDPNCERMTMIPIDAVSCCTNCKHLGRGTACECTCHLSIKKEPHVAEVVKHKGCTCTTMCCIHVPFDKNVVEYRVVKTNFYLCCLKFLATRTSDRTFYPQDGHKMYCPKCNGKIFLDGKVWRMNFGK